MLNPVLVHRHKRPVNQKIQEQNNETGQRKGGFIELLRNEANKLSSSDQEKWANLAEQVDDTEFTALLDEEWEKLSSKQKKKATLKAVDFAREMAFIELLRIAARDLPSAAPAPSAVPAPTAAPAPTAFESRLLAKEVGDDAELIKLLDKEWKKLSSEQKENCKKLHKRSSEQKKKWEKQSSEEKNEATQMAVEKFEKASEMARKTAAENKAADKKLWADCEKKRAKECREQEEKANEGKGNSLVETLVESIRKNKFKSSDAFKNMARIARISPESRPQKGYLSPLTTRTLWYFRLRAKRLSSCEPISTSSSPPRGYRFVTF